MACLSQSATKNYITKEFGLRACEIKKGLTSPVCRWPSFCWSFVTLKALPHFSCFLVCLDSFPNIHLHSLSALTSTLSKVNIIDAKVKCAICASRLYLLLCNHLLISIKINHNNIIASKTFCVRVWIITDWSDQSNNCYLIILIGNQWLIFIDWYFQDFCIEVCICFCWWIIGW